MPRMFVERLKTVPDVVGVMHEAVEREWPRTWELRCGSSALFHPGDIYYVHRRPVTCVACASEPDDING